MYCKSSMAQILGGLEPLGSHEVGATGNRSETLGTGRNGIEKDIPAHLYSCLLYTSDAADE